MGCILLLTWQSASVLGIIARVLRIHDSTRNQNLRSKSHDFIVVNERYRIILVINQVPGSKPTGKCMAGILQKSQSRTKSW